MKDEALFNKQKKIGIDYIEGRIDLTTLKEKMKELIE